MAIDSYSSSRAKQSKKAFDDYFGGGRGGVSNRSIPKGTTISPREKPEKSGIMSSLASAIEKGTQTRLGNEARRFGKAGEVRNRVVAPTTLSTVELQDMVDMGFNPATRDTSGNIVNPYGSGGLRQYISFPNLEQNQINEIYNKRVSRFLNPLDQDQSSLRRGFGSLFGSSEGEPTISGPLRKQVPEMTTTDMIARLGIGALTPFGPIVSMADTAGTKMVPEFSTDPENLYNPSMDPRNNPQSMVGNMLNFFTGGAGTEALSRISDLLPGGSQEVLPEQGPVADPFYPDMLRVDQLPLPELY